jgi:hypothetical protein
MKRLRGQFRNTRSVVLQTIGRFLLGLGSHGFARSDPFDRSSFADSSTSPDLERFGRLTSLDELVKQAAADAVRGAKIVDRLRLHLGSFQWKQKIPALTNQGRGKVAFWKHDRLQVVNIVSMNNGAL